MFENEIKFISDFSLNKIKNLGSFVTFEKLSASELHPALISYIAAELDYMIYRDRKKLLQNSIFDYTGREISDHFNVIAAEIKKNKKISIDDIEKLIYQAVSFNINYVVRPKWSITKLIYNDQDFISVDELDSMLEYLYYYDYVKNVLSAYTSRRKVIQLTLTEFDLILNKIDRELFKTNTEDLINNALHSIADFFNIGGIDKTKITLAAVEIFLKEKNMMDYLLKLRHSIPNSFRKKYEIADIKKVLYSKTTIYPESLPTRKESSINKNTDADIKFVDKKAQFKPDIVEKKIEAAGYDNIEIVTEEKIKSKISDEELIADEIFIEEMQEEIVPDPEQVNEELLPIEEEFQSEFFKEDTTVEAIESNVDFENIETDNSGEFDSPHKPSFEEEMIEIFTEDEDLKSNIEMIVTEKPEKETVQPENEIIIGDEESFAEETETKEDDLLSFYEQELAAMDEGEGTPPVHKKQPEVIEDNILNEINEIKKESFGDDKSSKEMAEEIDNVEEEVVEEEKINYDDFNFSVFDDESAEQDFNDILNKVSAEFHGELDEIHNNKHTASPEDSDSSAYAGNELGEDAERKLKDEIDEVDLSDTGKRVIEEMLDDYFGEENRKDKPREKENLIVETKDSEKIKPGEPVETPESEQPSEAVKDESIDNSEENVFNTNLASNILEGTSLGDDISTMMDEIDDIIEKNNLKISEAESLADNNGEGQTGESEFDEKLKLDEGINIGYNKQVDDELKDDAKPVTKKETVFEQAHAKEKLTEKQTVKQTPQEEKPAREKDLFSYLSRKEVKKIVSNVFASDHEDFVTTIEKISECSAYKEATEILKGVFFTYRVSPYSKEAVALTNSVSHYFRQI